MTARPLTPSQARALLVNHLHLVRPFGRGVGAIRRLLEQLRCIQLDPLDPMGTNADLVVLARVDGVGRGDVYRALYPHHAFEHWAKERCLVPASAFPWYRSQLTQAPWWRTSEREQRVPPKVIDAVLAEVRANGPLTLRELSDHGAVEPIDWSGWKGTGKAASMAIEILWTRCDVVVCGRTESAAKVFDVPERALPQVANEARGGDFERWALMERVAAAGLLSRAGGPWWSMLSHARTSALPDELVASGELCEVTIEGSPRRYLTTPEFLEQRKPRYDDRMRILGPLDPLLWDRALVRAIFDFDYVWEVYKPPAQRRWGWYVCPLLHRDRLVGRLEGRLADGVLRVSKIWREENAELDMNALEAAVQRHAQACSARRFTLPKRIR